MKWPIWFNCNTFFFTSIWKVLISSNFAISAVKVCKKPEESHKKKEQGGKWPQGHQAASGLNGHTNEAKSCSV